MGLASNISSNNLRAEIVLIFLPILSNEQRFNDFPTSAEHSFKVRVSKSLKFLFKFYTRKGNVLISNFFELIQYKFSLTSDDFFSEKINSTFRRDVVSMTFK